MKALMRHSPIALLIGLIAILACIAFVFTWKNWQVSRPKRMAIQYVNRFSEMVTAKSADGNPFEMVLLPSVYRQRTVQEQNDFVRKALMDEISEEGVRVIASKGEFGTLREMFPVEAESWTKPHGINPDECVAFKASKGNIQAELVLQVIENDYRIVRCNNIRQLAGPYEDND